MIVISPHLDDAIFSIGHTIRGLGAKVVTICAGIPGNGAQPTQFDQEAGFASAQEAVEARRAEDREAAELLGVEVIHLDCIDRMYGEAGPSLLGAVDEALSLEPGPWIGPLGLRHPDHVAISAAFRIGARARERDAFLYEDQPYAQRYPEELAEALTKTWRTDTRIRSVEGNRKRKACGAYRSQLPPDEEILYQPETIHRFLGEASL